MLVVFFLLTIAKSYCEDKLELRFADETNHLNPPHRFVPWVLVDNHALQEHGPDECSIDIVQACAIDSLPKHDGLSFKFIECIEKLNLEGRHGEWRSCINSLNLNPTPIMDCYYSRKGFNDYGNFVAYICKAYKGQNKPEACEQHVLETNSFKETNSSYQVSYRGEIEHSIPFNYNLY
nr:hypothetical protein [Tanacetum cinerariifolium]